MLAPEAEAGRLAVASVYSWAIATPGRRHKALKMNRFMDCCLVQL